MNINKYLLYLVVNVLVFLITLGPGAWKKLRYHEAMGEVTGYHVDERVNKKGKMVLKRYPEISFEVGDSVYHFFGPSYIATNFGSRVRVLFNPASPEQAVINGVKGIWGNSLLFLIPFFFIFSCIIFSVGFIPKRIRIG